MQIVFNEFNDIFAGGKIENIFNIIVWIVLMTNLSVRIAFSQYEFDSE